MSTLSLAYNRFGLGARGDDAPPEDRRAPLAACPVRPLRAAARGDRRGPDADPGRRRARHLYRRDADGAGGGAAQWRPAERPRCGPGPAAPARGVARAAGGGADRARDGHAGLGAACRARRRCRPSPMPPAPPWRPTTSSPACPTRPAASSARRAATIISPWSARGPMRPWSRRPRSSSGWSISGRNHFAVSADKLPVIGLAGLLEFEAIRPHVLGKFRDMLVAVEQHPAMLLYLDQAQSIGPEFARRPARRSASPASAAGSTRISRARSWSCTRSACTAATARPTSPNSRAC